MSSYIHIHFLELDPHPHDILPTDRPTDSNHPASQPTEWAKLPRASHQFFLTTPVHMLYVSVYARSVSPAPLDILAQP